MGHLCFGYALQTDPQLQNLKHGSQYAYLGLEIVVKKIN